MSDNLFSVPKNQYQQQHFWIYKNENKYGEFIVCLSHRSRWVDKAL